MGLGPQILDLYRKFKENGIFEDVHSVMELGSQGVWCHDRDILRGLFAAFGKPLPPAGELEVYVNDNGSGNGSSRQLHEWLGFEYQSIDLDGRWGATRLDLNVTEVFLDTPYMGAFDLVTYHGTTEHIFNQYNAFKVIHDLTKADGGLMLHELPMTAAYHDHGLYSYQPNFFTALAKANGYRVDGMWVMPNWRGMELWAWGPGVREWLVYGPNATHLIIVLLRKIEARKFRVPMQGIYASIG